MDRIIENISSSTEEYTSVDDCITRAGASATGAFCAGFSGGVAAQVHFARYLPGPMKAVLFIPTAAATIAGVSMYKHSMRQCQLNYMQQPAPMSHTIALHPAIQTTEMKIEKV